LNRSSFQLIANQMKDVWYLLNSKHAQSIEQSDYHLKTLLRQFKSYQTAKNVILKNTNKQKVTMQPSEISVILILARLLRILTKSEL